MADEHRYERAVILGGSLAGFLAAAAVARYFRRVTVIERGPLPDGPLARKGVPQAHHAHVLWSSGARAIDALQPGFLKSLQVAGARLITVPGDTLIFSTEGWLRRWPGIQFLVAATRDLIDWVVRQEAVKGGRVDVRENVAAIGLVGNKECVRGVSVRDTSTGAVEELPADLVVDATGRSSAAPKWLAELGLPRVKESVVDAGLTYATQIFRAPLCTGDALPLINVQAKPRSTGPGQAAGILPIEGGRWMVTLSSTKGAAPPSDANGFVDFARRVRHPLVGDLIQHAEPLAPISITHNTANRRRYYEKLPRWPDRFVVIGDAAATFNPIYGHGMSVVAHCATALRRSLEREGLRPRAAQRLQRRIGQQIDPAWMTAISQDVLFPGTVGMRATILTRSIQRYLERVTRAGITRPVAAKALFDTFTLSSPMTRLVSPQVVLAAIRSFGVAPSIDPPFSPTERAIIAKLLAPSPESDD